MLLILKINFMIILIFLISSCGFSNPEFTNINNMNNINIETPNDKDNVLFKEYLRRDFKTDSNQSYKFLLRTNITFSSNPTLSGKGLNSLNKTAAIVGYELYHYDSKQLIKSGSIKSFPVIGSTSVSLYANDISSKHIRERLSLVISKKLYMNVKIILRRLL